MQKNCKLCLATLGFLGANGAILPNLNNLGINFSSIELPINLARGGHSRSVKVEKSNFEYGKNLGSRQTTPIEFSQESSQIPKIELDLTNLKQNQTLNLLKDVIPQDSQIISNISNLHEKIEKAEKIMDLKNQADSKFQTLSQKHLSQPQDKLKTPLEVFNQIKDQVKQNKPSRVRRGASQEPPQALTKEQRKILKEFYQLHTDLNEIKTEISSQLKKIDSEVLSSFPEAQAQTSQHDSSSILSSLSRLG